jgi:hypothetical protein
VFAPSSELTTFLAALSFDNPCTNYAFLCILGILGILGNFYLVYEINHSLGAGMICHKSGAAENWLNSSGVVVT